MSNLHDPTGDTPERRRARLIAGTILLVVVVILAIIAIINVLTPARTKGIRQSVTRDGVTVTLEIDSPTVAAGSTVSGQVTVVNSSGHDVGNGGPGSCAKEAFVVNLDDGHGNRTAQPLAIDCTSGYRFPSGTTTDDLRIPAKDGAGRSLPPGRYQAELAIAPAYPLPVPAPVPFTIRSS